MARPLRLDQLDGWHHVMNRGIERRAIFNDDGDRRHFVELLCCLEESHGVQVHAYCLMDNHYHLALHTPGGVLSRCLKWLGQSYVGWFNRRHNRVGPLFQGRFKSVPVDPDGWLEQLSVYIHLNPVKTTEFGLGKAADIAEAKGAGDEPTSEEISSRLRELRQYKWSSLRAYAGYASKPAWLHTDRILKSMGAKPKDQRERYRQQLRQLLKRGVEETGWEQFNDRVAVGSNDFIEKIRQSVGEPSRETEKRRRFQQGRSFEEIIEAVESVRGEAASEWLNRHGDCGKWMVMVLADRHCELTQSELGERMGGMDYAAVSAGKRRFEKRMAKDRRVRTMLGEMQRLLNVET
jgi:putative transposase